MDTRRLTRFGITLILVMFSVSAGFSQSVSDGTLTGSVTLPSGENAPGVTVTIKSDRLVSGERMTVTDSDGRFVFLSLPPGDYDVTASLGGFKTFSAPDIELGSGDKRDVRIRLQTGAYEESIVVSGAAPIVDTRSSTIDTTLSSQLLEKLPTKRDAFYDLALTAPGVASVGADETWLKSPSAFGGAANENIFLVNGVNATNPRGAPWGSLVSVNYNTVEEVKIISLGSKAEYGSFSGTAIDVLTKSGSNKFSGDVAYYSMVGNAADNATLDFGNETPRFDTGQDTLFYANPDDILTLTPKDSWEATVTLGGPIMKDRLWFYAGYGSSESETDTPLFDPLQTWDQQIFDIKLTGEFSAQHRLWAAYHTEDQTAGNNSWGDTWDATMVYDQPRDNDTMQLQYQWVMSERDLSSFKFLGFKTAEHPRPTGSVGHPGFINWWKWIGTQSIGVGGDFPYIEQQLSERQTLQADYTHYAAKFLGEHEMKFGVQYTRSEGNWVGGYFQGYANFAYPYGYHYPGTSLARDWWWNGPEGWQYGTDENPVLPFYVNQYHMNPFLTVRKAGSNGVFVDDTWTLNDRVTLDLGLRYDQMNARYGEGAVYEPFASPDEVDNPTKIRTRAGTDDIFDFKTWSPRIGVAWILTDDNRTVLRAHAGRYFAPLGVETLRRFGPDMDPTTIRGLTYWIPATMWDLNHNGMIDYDEVRPATRLLSTLTPVSVDEDRVVDPSWELLVEDGTTSPYTDQFNISLARQIGNDFAIEGSYIYKHTQDLLSLRPFNELTGEYWNWVEKPYTTWTGFDTSVWELERNDYDGDGDFDMDDARYVWDHTGYKAGNMSDFAGQKAQRKYGGLQFVVTKRYSRRWQGLASVNWNTSDGVAPRTVDQNWYIDGPMIMDTPFGSTLNHFQNNLEGPLLMTPEWMVKFAGSYTIPVIETDLGLRYRYDSGRPLFPIEGINTIQSWMSSIEPQYYFAPSGGGAGQVMVADNPNHVDWMPSTSIVDLSLSKNFKIDRYGMALSFDILNATNESAPNRIGFHQGDYGRVYSVVSPRIYRAGVKLLF